MDFSWSGEEGALYERCLAFATEKLNQSVVARDGRHEFGVAEWSLCGEFGLTGLCVPAQYGGTGLGTLSTAHVFAAFGRGCEDTGLAFSVAAHLFACSMPIVEHGTEELKARTLGKLSRGEWIGANAITEPDAGSDVYAIKTRAERDGDDYVLNGTKSYVTNGPVADLLIVYASTQPNFGYMGLSAFVVDAKTTGLVIGKPFDKIGLTTSPTCSVYFDSCRVPAGNRLAEEGQGAFVFESSMVWERACLFAIYLGQMERQLDVTVRHVQERRQSGKKIGAYQAVSHRIADMKLRLESARLLLYRACWLRDQGRDATLEIALSKLAISEAAVSSALDAIQLHGGTGTIRDAGIERALRDAVPSTIFSGTSEIQRNLIATRLGL